MNNFLVGDFQKTFSLSLPRGKFLFLHDEIIDIDDKRRPVVFDPYQASCNPLSSVDYHYAAYFVEVMRAVFPAGENTLTKENGLDYILQAVLQKPNSLEDLIPKPDKNSSSGHQWAYSKINRLLASPVLKKVFDPDANQFKFSNRVVLARLNRAELGDFDALVLGLFLIGQFQGHIVLPDFGFYAREMHMHLKRQERLTAAVRYLDELKHVPKLRQEYIAQLTLQLRERDISETLSNVLYRDAVLLAEHAGLRPNSLQQDNAYNRFIDAAMRSA